jgi:hypothetical protein
MGAPDQVCGFKTAEEEWSLQNLEIREPFFYVETSSA